MRKFHYNCTTLAKFTVSGHNSITLNHTLLKLSNSTESHQIKNSLPKQVYTIKPIIRQYRTPWRDVQRGEDALRVTGMNFLERLKSMGFCGAT